MVMPYKFEEDKPILAGLAKRAFWPDRMLVE